MPLPADHEFTAENTKLILDEALVLLEARNRNEPGANRLNYLLANYFSSNAPKVCRNIRWSQPKQLWMSGGEVRAMVSQKSFADDAQTLEPKILQRMCRLGSPSFL
jgi:anti-sigma factor ChrR (cupin superfamily)